MELHNLLKEERLSGSSLLILANKQDIKGALTQEEISKVLNLEAMDKMLAAVHTRMRDCSKDLIGWSKTLPLGSMCLTKASFQ
ncbi:hypothetical protein ACLB2K_050562 [Fragaria x ananassa]